MGKYMRKAKTAEDVALREVAQSSFGVRTRARTLALQRLQKSEVSSATVGGSYLQLRSRRLEKSQNDSKRQKQSPKQIFVSNPNPNSKTSSRLMAGSLNSSILGLDYLNKEWSNLGSEKLGSKFEENHENNNVDLGGVEASYGENVLEFEGRERCTRENTPCSLIRDPESVRTPCSTTRSTCSAEAYRGVQNSIPRHIPTAREMDDFFSGAEKQQQMQFIDKYNFDPVNDMPLPGRYEWAKLNP